MSLLNDQRNSFGMGQVAAASGISGYQDRPQTQPTRSNLSTIIGDGCEVAGELDKICIELDNFCRRLTGQGFDKLNQPSAQVEAQTSFVNTVDQLVHRFRMHRMALHNIMQILNGEL